MFCLYKDLVTKELLSKFKYAFLSNSTYVLAQNVCTQYDPFQIALSSKRIHDQTTPSDFFSTIVIN